ncbi:MULTISPECIES: hypothetical protein [Ureibacillus]|jgi:cyclic lactone autoinducer peptide|uniref:Cyclic lactone autoinducer peptide n=1 Tax=Ureibacillus thermosphaericus TaxID=51173 RepID=A0A840PUT0_URETH|nr:hypothetical protein [Ureibacillus thermosphaericus]MBB5148491.1 cyclic lactone autoinducer peptide [Ureibacillus thermosphaericus]NKZ30985.1 hypothetical protein [Ureibacillus thermosphaericus]
MKMNWMNVKNLISKIAMVVVAVGGTATITGCTTLFHEKKISNELLENNPFATKK